MRSFRPPHNRRRKLSRKTLVRIRREQKAEAEAKFVSRMMTAEKIYSLPPLEDMALRRRRYSAIASTGNDQQSKNILIEKYQQAETAAKVQAVGRKSKESGRRTNIYFIGGGIHSPIKIGKADDVKHRLKGIQTGNPTPLRILGIMYDMDPALEKDLHRDFARYRMEGEWFRSNHELLELIRGLYGGDAIFRQELSAYFASKEEPLKTPDEVFFGQETHS